MVQSIIPISSRTSFVFILVILSGSIVGQSLQAEISEANQTAVFGQNKDMTPGVISYGVVGFSFSEFGVGVYGQSYGSKGTGLIASGPTGIKAFGDKIAINAEADSLAIYGESLQTGGIAIKGNGKTAGVVGLCESGSGTGVSGQSVDGIGVEGYSGNGGSFDFYASGAGMNYGAASSQRWKIAVRNIDNPIAKINALRGVYYTWDKAHGGQRDIGFIAEEVGEVLPEIVAYEENGVDAKGLDYSKVTPLLVEAFKKLHQEYIEIQREFQEAIQQIQDLKKRLVQLEE